MSWALVDDSGKIKNIIVYNGHDPYTPPDGLKLIEVSDDKKIDDLLDK